MINIHYTTSSKVNDFWYYFNNNYYIFDKFSTYIFFFTSRFCRNYCITILLIIIQIFFNIYYTLLITIAIDITHDRRSSFNQDENLPSAWIFGYIYYRYLVSIFRTKFKRDKHRPTHTNDKIYRIKYAQSKISPVSSQSKISTLF